jgi:hypothetical protein
MWSKPPRPASAILQPPLERRPDPSRAARIGPRPVRRPCVHGLGLTTGSAGHARPADRGGTDKVARLPRDGRNRTSRGNLNFSVAAPSATCPARHVTSPNHLSPRHGRRPRPSRRRHPGETRLGRRPPFTRRSRAALPPPPATAPQPRGRSVSSPQPDPRKFLPPIHRLGFYAPRPQASVVRMSSVAQRSSTPTPTSLQNRKLAPRVSAAVPAVPPEQRADNERSPALHVKIEPDQP